jgi:hypothetical protein
MAFAETLAPFFADFAVAMTLPSSAVVMGLFDNEFVDVYGTVQSAKVFTCQAADVAGLAVGNAVTIGGTSYTVAEKQADGTGLTRVLLK